MSAWYKPFVPLISSIGRLWLAAWLLSAMWLAETWSCPAAELSRGWSTAPPVTSKLRTILEDISKYFLVFLVDCFWLKADTNFHPKVMALWWLLFICSLQCTGGPEPTCAWWHYSLLNTLLLHNGPQNKQNIQILEGFEDWIKHITLTINPFMSKYFSPIKHTCYLDTKFIIITGHLSFSPKHQLVIDTISVPAWYRK